MYGYFSNSICSQNVRARNVTNTRQTNDIHVELLEYEIHPPEIFGIWNALADMGAFIAPCAVQSTEESLYAGKERSDFYLAVCAMRTSL